MPALGLHYAPLTFREPPKSHPFRSIVRTHILRPGSRAWHTSVENKIDRNWEIIISLVIGGDDGTEWCENLVRLWGEIRIRTSKTKNGSRREDILDL